MTSATGFEPVRAEPNRFLICLLNHSDTPTKSLISAGLEPATVCVLDRRLSDSGDPARTINKEELNPNLFGIKSYKMSTKIQVPEVFDSSCNFDAEEWIE
ncbi:hypothetical protein BB560_004979, partial [Smittium megazygosporum]